MKENKKMDKLPTYGIGPIYVAIIIILTIIGFVLRGFGLLDSGMLPGIKVSFIIIGIVLIVLGVAMWILAVPVAKIDDGLKETKLIQRGIYGYVRNPIYSAFMIACTGICFLAQTLWLLILPPVFWLILTVMLKPTEEKWLYEFFGDEYVDYCKRVNRCIPWFPKK